MCGIVGYIGQLDAKEILLKGLEKLEYRGYDSAGIAVANEDGVHVFKEKGRIADEIDRLGMTRVMEETIDYLRGRTDGVHLSLDLDALDPNDAPGVGTPVAGGISYRESHLAMEMLEESKLRRSA